MLYEYDARRRAKQINCELNTERIIDDYLAGKIEAKDSSEEYTYLRNININDDYDLGREYKKFMSANSSDIEKKVEEILSKKCKTDKEERFMDMYENYLKRLPICHNH